MFKCNRTKDIRKKSKIFLSLQFPVCMGVCARVSEILTAFTLRIPPQCVYTWSSFHHRCLGLRTYCQFPAEFFLCAGEVLSPHAFDDCFRRVCSFFSGIPVIPRLQPLCPTACLCPFRLSVVFTLDHVHFSPSRAQCYSQQTQWLLTQLLWFLPPCCTSCSPISAPSLRFPLVSRSFPEPPGTLLRIRIRCSD